jgi:ATP-dependent Lhr-like helicase
LARIHRYTLKQLRSEIEPVAPADFMRFLFHWQGLDDPGEGEAALQRTLLQLEGISVPAGSWENDILPARLRSYTPSDLDALCSAGKIAWLRPRAPADNKSERRKNPVIQTTKIALVARPHLPQWQAYTPLPPIETLTLSGSAHTVCTALRELGASFFEELLAHTGLLKSQLKDALGELAACGLVTSDSFHGLRTLITPERVQRHRHRRRVDDQHARAGRWSLLRAHVRSEERDHHHAEHIARVLLRRYGVVFRKLLERESGLPPWRELLYAYRRMEARGELRGGRFVQGFAGEQYALPEAVSTLRTIRNKPKRGDLIAISAADPLNLTGAITPERRAMLQQTHRLLYRDGIPVAFGANAEITLFDRIDVNEAASIRNVLLRREHLDRVLPAPSPSGWKGRQGAKASHRAPS